MNINCINKYIFSTLSEHGPWWTSQMDCRGNETKLSQCDSMAWGEVHDCPSPYSAGVLCYSVKGQL